MGARGLACRSTPVERKSERRTGAQLIHRLAIYQRVAQTHIEGEIVTYLPDGSDPRRKRFVPWGSWRGFLSPLTENRELVRAPASQAAENADKSMARYKICAQ